MRTLLCVFLLCSFVWGQDSNSAGQGQSLADMARKLRKDHTQEVRLTPEEEKKLLKEAYKKVSEDLKEKEVLLRQKDKEILNWEKLTKGRYVYHG